MKEPPRAGGHWGIVPWTHMDYSEREEWFKQTRLRNVSTLFYPTPPPPEDVFSWESTWILKLSKPIRSCLREANIYWIGELLEKTPAELKQIRGLGQPELREIRKELQKLKLHLKADRSRKPKRSSSPASSTDSNAIRKRRR